MIKYFIAILVLFSNCSKGQLYYLGTTATNTAFNNAIIACDGNSLTHGEHSTDTLTKSYPGVLRTLSPFSFNGATIYNFGVNSQTTPNMISDAATQIDPLYNSSVKSILIAWEIGNDIYFNGSASSAYTNIVSYCNSRRAAGWKVIVVTAAYREHSVCCGGVTPFGDNDAAYDAKRLTANTSVRANWSTFADAIYDLALDPNFSSYNTTYFYSDKVHYVDAGYAYIANGLLPIILSL